MESPHRQDAACLSSATRAILEVGVHVGVREVTLCAINAVIGGLAHANAEDKVHNDGRRVLSYSAWDP